MAFIGYVGVAAFALAWLPQCWETIRERRCPVNLAFLLLSATGSFALALYAYQRGDTVFSTLNTMTTAGALVNVYYRVAGRA